MGERVFFSEKVKKVEKTRVSYDPWNKIFRQFQLQSGITSRAEPENKRDGLVALFRQHNSHLCHINSIRWSFWTLSMPNESWQRVVLDIFAPPP